MTAHAGMSHVPRVTPPAAHHSKLSLQVGWAVCACSGRGRLRKYKEWKNPSIWKRVEKSLNVEKSGEIP